MRGSALAGGRRAPDGAAGDVHDLLAVVLGGDGVAGVAERPEDDAGLEAAGDPMPSCAHQGEGAQGLVDADLADERLVVAAHVAAELVLAAGRADPHPAVAGGRLGDEVAQRLRHAR